MHKRIVLPFIISVWLCLIVTSVNAQPSTALSSNSIFKTKTLRNGLQIIVIENHLTPIATVAYVAKNGSYTESEEFAGLSHLYEHMFFKENRVIPNEEAFNERNRELGMQNNASTAEEVVEYHFTMPAKNLDSGIQFMSYAIMSPAFDSGDIEREREVVLGEFDRNEADPLFALSRAMDSALWGSDLVRKEPLGQRPVIKSATPPKMFAIEHKFYIPNNSALLVAGDVNPEDVFRLADKYLGAWPPGPPPFPKYSPPPFPPLKTQVVIRPAPETPTVIVNLEFHGPSLGKDNPGTYAVDLFSTIVNAPTSRLYKDLVDSGLVLNYNVGYYSQQNVGPITISMECTPDKAKQAIRQLWKEIGMWTTPGYYTDEELTNAKERIAINRLYEQENPTNFLVSSVTFSWAVTGLDYYEHYIDNVKKMTRTGVNSFLNTYIEGQPYVFGIATNPDALATLHFTDREVMQ